MYIYSITGTCTLDKRDREIISVTQESNLLFMLLLHFTITEDLVFRHESTRVTNRTFTHDLLGFEVMLWHATHCTLFLCKMKETRTEKELKKMFCFFNIQKGIRTAALAPHLQSGLAPYPHHPTSAFQGKELPKQSHISTYHSFISPEWNLLEWNHWVPHEIKLLRCFVVYKNENTMQQL